MVVQKPTSEWSKPSVLISALALATTWIVAFFAFVSGTGANQFRLEQAQSQAKVNSDKIGALESKVAVLEARLNERDGK